MSYKKKSLAWATLFLGVGLLGGLAFVVGRPGRPAEPKHRIATIPQPQSQFVQGESAKEGASKPRNLSLRPEAFSMGRRLGARFSPSRREKSVLEGTLTIGSERRNVQTIRTQTDKGEQVEIKLAGTPGSLTWEAGQGARSGVARATGGERELVERLVLDSPDQFVLAQLRGASYLTVARNVRPTEADDNYAGPLWDIVRVDDPQQEEEKKPESVWRLYYINTRTGLIDRIVSQLRGETIEAEISGWTTLNGENLPTQITWNKEGQTIMQYRLTNFSHGQK